MTSQVYKNKQIRHTKKSCGAAINITLQFDKVFSLAQLKCH